MLHFSQVWPPNAPAARECLGRAKRVVSVEGNCTGQFASVLREAGLLSGCELLRRCDGLPFTGEYIVSRVRR
jgi:pyruvate/2-oxoacid:ferredoxin oxidoreductase alpha subunit